MKKFVLISLLLIIVFGCGHKNKYPFKTKAEKLFYTDCAGMDYVRFPLIYPYEVMNADFNNEKWIINLQKGIGRYTSVYKLARVTVVNDLIMAQTEDSSDDIVDEAPLRLFVIIPSKQMEVGFSTEKEFNEYVNKCGIYKIRWWNVRDAFKKFEETDCLPWIPGCGEE